MSEKKPLVHVAVGVIINQDNQVLIARRAAQQHQGGLWEFPGGKVDPGETSREALDREMREELGIQVQSATVLLEISHEYEDKNVILDIFLVDRWQGEACGREGQPVRWVDRRALDRYQFPAANAEILRTLASR